MFNLGPYLLRFREFDLALHAPDLDLPVFCGCNCGCGSQPDHLAALMLGAFVQTG